MKESAGKTLNLEIIQYGEGYVVKLTDEIVDFVADISSYDEYDDAKKAEIRKAVSSIPRKYLNIEVKAQWQKLWHIIVKESRSAELFNLIKDKIDNIDKGDTGFSRCNIVGELMNNPTAKDDELLAALIDAGAKYDYKDQYNGNTILHLAAVHNLAKTLEAILRNNPKVDLNCKNDKGVAPLYIYGCGANYAVFSLLVKNGADPSYYIGEDSSSLLCEILGNYIRPSATDIFKIDERSCVLLLKYGAKFKEGEKYVEYRIQEFYKNLSFSNKFSIALSNGQYYAAANLLLNELLNCFGMGNKECTVDIAKNGKTTATALSNSEFAIAASCIIAIPATIIAAVLNREVLTNAAHSLMGSRSF